MTGLYLYLLQLQRCSKHRANGSPNFMDHQISTYYDRMPLSRIRTHLEWIKMGTTTRAFGDHLNVSCCPKNSSGDPIGSDDMAGSWTRLHTNIYEKGYESTAQTMCIMLFVCIGLGLSSCIVTTANKEF